MRSILFAGYFFALGWWVRASGLDEEMAAIGRDAWKLAVLHTARIIREDQDPARQLEEKVPA